MPQEEMTFKARCHKCNRTFHVRFPLADPDAEGKGDVAVSCLHCEEEGMITIPRTHIAQEIMTRGVDLA